MHRIKKNFIKSLFLIISFLFLTSCGLHRVTGELEIKVNKVGKLDNNSNYIFIYPEFAKDSLKYQAIANNIVVELKKFGFTKVDNKKDAKYAFAFIINTLSSKSRYRKENNDIIDTLDYDDILKMNILDNILEAKGQQTLIWESYLINNKGLYTKVMEGYTKEVQQKPKNNNEGSDKGTIGFVNCSISALFENKVSSKSYQEYYYKCL